MTDREKIIKAIQDGIDFFEDRAHGSRFESWIRAQKDALALLKAQEPVEARLHLCESCTKVFPECEATVDDIEFGCGVGNDNIIGCTAYVNRWKAQEPVKPIENAGFYYCGACKYAFTSARQKYCSDCGRAVKWE